MIIFFRFLSFTVIPVNLFLVVLIFFPVHIKAYFITSLTVHIAEVYLHLFMYNIFLQVMA